LVRARASGLRLRVRHVQRSVREARGSASDHHPDVARRATVTERQALHRRQRHQPTASDRPRARDDRWVWREEDAPHGRPVRGRVEPHIACRPALSQARSAAAAL
jgi:hypothetical protein